MIHCLSRSDQIQGMVACNTCKFRNFNMPYLVNLWTACVYRKFWRKQYFSLVTKQYEISGNLRKIKQMLKNKFVIGQTADDMIR